MKNHLTAIGVLALCLAVAFVPLPSATVVSGGDFRSDMKSAADSLWLDVVDAAHVIGDGIEKGEITGLNLKENVDKAEASIGKRLAERMQTAFSRHVKNAPPNLSEEEKAKWDKEFTPRLVALLRGLK